MTSWLQIFPSIGTAVASAAQWLARTAPTLTITAPTSGTYTAATAETVAIKPAPILATMNNGVSASVVTSGTGTPVIAADKYGIAAGVILPALFAKPSETWRVANTFTNLVQTTYITAATSTGSWATPANAQGAPDSANATNTSTPIAAASGVLTGTFATQVGKTQLVISQATLSFYYSSSLIALGVMSTAIDYSLNSGSTWTNLSTSAAAASFATTPQIFDISTAVAQSWASLTAIQIRVTYTSPQATLNTSISVDSVQLTVTASQTVPS